MKKLLLLTMFASLLFAAGCSKDDDDNNPVGPGGYKNDGGTTTITGKIEGWTLGTGKTIALTLGYSSTEAYGSGSIAADGSFSITAKAPDAAAPLLKEVWDTDCPGSVTLSASDAYFMLGYLTVLEGNNIIGYVDKEVDTETMSCYSIFFYASKDVNANGSESCSEGSTSNFSMSFKKGWNLLYNVDQNTETESVETLTTAEPAGAAYHFYSTVAPT